MSVLFIGGPRHGIHYEVENNPSVYYVSTITNCPVTNMYPPLNVIESNAVGYYLIGAYNTALDKRRNFYAWDEFSPAEAIDQLKNYLLAHWAEL